MIPFTFEYHRPETVAEAVAVHKQLQEAGKDPLYYGGGTEIISQARLGQVRTGAVIDIKRIPECRVMDRDGGHLVFGAGVTLAEISDANPWPLLTDAADRVADHTVRCKITLGGNLAGTIQYREAALPFMLVAAEAVVAAGSGLRRLPLAQVFDGELQLAPGELLVQLRVPVEEARLPGVAVKKTRLDWIDYPLVGLAALEKGGELRVAVTGLCQKPFRSEGMEAALNGRGSAEQRVQRALRAVPQPVIEDLHGSSAYREFVLQHTLVDVIHQLEGVVP